MSAAGALQPAVLRVALLVLSCGLEARLGRRHRFSVLGVFINFAQAVESACFPRKHSLVMPIMLAARGLQPQGHGAALIFGTACRISFPVCYASRVHVHRARSLA